MAEFILRALFAQTCPKIEVKIKFATRWWNLIFSFLFCIWGSLIVAARSVLSAAETMEKSCTVPERAALCGYGCPLASPVLNNWEEGLGNPSEQRMHGGTCHIYPNREEGEGGDEGGEESPHDSPIHYWTSSLQLHFLLTTGAVAIKSIPTEKTWGPFVDSQLFSLLVTWCGWWGSVKHTSAGYIILVLAIYHFQHLQQ